MGEHPGEAPPEADEKAVVATRVLDAPRALVWKAWTDPDIFARWFGPRGFTTPVCELDVRPGGAMRVHMRGPDGTVYPMTGVSIEVVEPERLVFLDAVPDGEGRPIFEVQNTVTFAEAGGRTTLTLHARVVRRTPAAAPYIAGMDEGWSQTLDRLAEWLASGANERR